MPTPGGWRLPRGNESVELAFLCVVLIIPFRSTNNTLQFQELCRMLATSARRPFAPPSGRLNQKNARALASWPEPLGTRLPSVPLLPQPRAATSGHVMGARRQRGRAGPSGSAERRRRARAAPR